MKRAAACISPTESKSRQAKRQATCSKGRGKEQRRQKAPNVNVTESNEVNEATPTRPLDCMFGLEYTFTLLEGSDHATAGVGDDAVNLPEWLAPIPLLEALAKEAGLEMEYAQNFHEFYALRRNDPSTHNSLYNMNVLNRHGSISEEDWEICRLYVALKFRKVRESTITLDEDDGVDVAAAAAGTFYDGLTRSLDTRADSRLFHMRSFNGWVKAMQIQELDPRSTCRGAPLRVLDLACGKGGDLGK